MHTFGTINHRYLLAGLIVLSGLFGWFVPEFYDWSGADQSRPSPWLLGVPLGMLGISLLGCAALPWISLSAWTDPAAAGKTQFGIRGAMMLTLAVAVGIAAGMRYPQLLSAAFILSAIALLFRRAFRVPRQRYALAALVACLVLPGLWVFRNPQFTGSLVDAFIGIASIPSVFPMALLASILKSNQHEMAWMAPIMTAGWLLLGMFLVGKGEKRSIAYMTFMMHLSLISSIVLHAFTRA